MHSDASSPQEEITLRALLFEEDEGWSAQVLEYDIACQAKTLQALFGELARTIAGTAIVATELGLEPFTGINPAPQKFHERWEASMWRRMQPLPVEAPPSFSHSPFSLEPALHVGELQAV